jgi:hypothetical protein
MSTNSPSDGPDTDQQQPAWLRTLINVGIIGFFIAGVGVSAASFGLFGCICTDGITLRQKPADKPPEPPVADVDAVPVKEGDAPRRIY